MRYIFIILAFLSFSVYSQSVKIDGATGQVSDLSEVTEGVSTDLVILERSDSSKKITYANFTAHSGGMAYISTEGTQTIGTGGTFEKLYEGAMVYTAAHLDDFTESNGRLTYTGTVSKHFAIMVFASVESDEANARIQIRIAKDGSTITATDAAHDFTAVDTDAVLAFNWLIELATDEYIEVFGTSDQNGDTFVVHNLTLIITEMYMWLIILLIPNIRRKL